MNMWKVIWMQRSIKSIFKYQLINWFQNSFLPESRQNNNQWDGIKRRGNFNIVIVYDLKLQIYIRKKNNVIVKSFNSIVLIRFERKRGRDISELYEVRRSWNDLKAQ